MGLLTVACSEHSVPVAPPVDLVPAAPVSLAKSAVLTCNADVAARSVSCGDAAPALAGGAQGDIIVGGQNLYVKLTSTTPSYNVGTGVFMFDVTVQNLLPQAMGTTDGTTGDGSGVAVFFQSLPVKTAGSGVITVSNPTQTNGAFTGSNQTYYQYPGAMLGLDNILSTAETSSPKTWIFNVPSTVTSFSFAVYVSANVPAPTGYITVSPSAPSIIAAGTQALSATVKSAVGNTIAGQTVNWSTGSSAIATVASDGTITAVAPGSTTITATSGSRSGTTTVTVCPNLTIGGVSVITGPTAASFCLAGSSGSEYAVVPYNGDASSTLGVSVTATGISAVAAGAPDPYVAPARAVSSLGVFSTKIDVDAEAVIRDRERALQPLLAGSRARMSRGGPASRGLTPGTPSRSITPGVPSVGDVMTLNVSLTSCSAPDNQAATVKSVGTHSVVLAQNNNNSINTFTQAEYDDIAATFDTLVYPLVTGAFGLPADIDNNGGRIVILFTRNVNQMTPASSSSYTGGFVFSRDLLDAASCPTSNVGEMFYMLAPDSTAIDNNVRTATFVKGVTIGTLAHEFQHLINASRRIYVNGAGSLEDAWLNEGLSHVSEELLFNHVAGRSPGAGTTISDLIPQPTQSYFFKYAEANFGRYRQHLLAPETSSAQQPSSTVQLATRGAAWAFLRYAADRFVPAPTDQTSFFRSLVNSTTSGKANLSAVLGTSVDPWFRDFAAAVYAADMGVGTVGTAYQMPTWNFRSVFGGLNYGSGPAYPLAVVNPTSGAAYSPTLALGGGAAYLRMGVAASTYAPVTITKAGGGALPATFSAMVIRRK